MTLADLRPDISLIKEAPSIIPWASSSMSSDHHLEVIHVLISPSLASLFTLSGEFVPCHPQQMPAGRLREALLANSPPNTPEKRADIVRKWLGGRSWPQAPRRAVRIRRAVQCWIFVKRMSWFSNPNDPRLTAELPLDKSQLDPPRLEALLLDLSSSPSVPGLPLPLDESIWSESEFNSLSAIVLIIFN